MVIFHSYVSLPEGNRWILWVAVRSDYEAAKEQLERRRSSAEAQQKSHALNAMMLK